MKNVKFILLALSMLICFVVKAQEKTTTKDTLHSILTNKVVICAPSRLLINEPLTILDGVVIDSKQFSGLNPNDIENIKVLKGIDATSIYGNKAINGAIVITTKKKN
ncbi:TonB-dependent receptor plug domain-containing protein [Flavobacterium sp. AC]|uniref:TonB-dependent receptor plug domain-containing protein n=1 Tax=Flavobacterium azizsancarii TaxID=2961580 RepID=A0ABT4W8J9_9FLAO|nr:TonB-dependent receptor plug domain-containing protein [Flavobacterium azizsancarii]MDA6068582.1 TonB-dependent receptor plug domain-containing protein [Flavobacterium azizsancarii]